MTNFQIKRHMYIIHTYDGPEVQNVTASQKSATTNQYNNTTTSTSER